MKFFRVLALPVLAVGLVGCTGETNEASTEEDIEKLVQEQVNAALEQAEQAEAGADKQPEAAPQQQPEPQQSIAEPVAVPKVQTVNVETDQSNMTHVQVTSNDANIREQASLTSQVVYAGTMHDTFEYLKEKVHTSDGRTWYKVSYGNGVGYMSSAVATLMNANNTVSVHNNGGNTIIITSSDGNVRAEPSLNGSVIYKGKKGESLSYTGDAVNSSDGRLWYKVIVNGNIGYISKRVASLSEDYHYGIDKSEFLITSAEGNVRAQPSMNSAVIYKGTKGEALHHTGYYEKTSDGRTWYEVYIAGAYGYISGKVGHVQ